MKPEQINFLKDVLENQRNLRNSLDHKASFILGLAGVVFVLSLGHWSQVGFRVMAIFSLLTCLFGLWTISPVFRKQEKSGFNLMCFWGFGQKSFPDYQKEVKKTLKDENKITAEYLKEVYYLSKHSLRLKSLLIKLSSLFLTLGLVMGFILIVVGF